MPAVDKNPFVDADSKNPFRRSPLLATNNPFIDVSEHQSTSSSTRLTKVKTSVDFLPASLSAEKEDQRRSRSRSTIDPEHPVGSAKPSSSRLASPRQRSNSESSVMDDKKQRDRLQQGKDLDREKGRERRHHRKEKEEKSRSSNKKRGEKSSLSKKKAPLDKIDRLDVTGLYGSGFHHDGPFDACNPHRNKNLMRAPVAAFPEDSASNTLKGAGKIPALNTDQFYGDRDPEAFNDFSAGQNTGIRSETKYRPGLTIHAASFDPSRNTEPVHGDESLGLGTSTFLEGAPASRVAMERRISEEESNGQSNKLGRSKSLAQRFRGVKYEAPGRPVISPGSAGTAKIGSPPYYLNDEMNPFDDMKDTRVSAHENTNSFPLTTGSPPRGGASLLSRVRSLKVSNARGRDK
ncbi:hypothetical protein NEOLI_003240 [Neolecta irregularis DAH-3]|uniref:Protein PAL1 n=1 Tax=Neolecta irregularis (strain DAH-3) TaxID=1198029 RepID=A0A1U7LS37_NEOID|nr:hypothetical protein NEOLI_003240 [Neolecta irregularis DAH-3]|eukprot:OLL25486.1 hypothetical protein NEOLI_003240 [Neolecta irregularis DAH-3]